MPSIQVLNMQGASVGEMPLKDEIFAIEPNTAAMHLVKMIRNDRERREIHETLLDCSAEFSHYVTDHELPLSHLSLSDAVAALGLPFAVQALTSLADTLA